MHIYIYIYIYTYLRTRKHTYIVTFLLTYLHSHIYIYSYTLASTTLATRYGSCLFIFTFSAFSFSVAVKTDDALMSNVAALHTASRIVCKSPMFRANTVHLSISRTGRDSPKTTPCAEHSQLHTIASFYLSLRPLRPLILLLLPISSSLTTHLGSLTHGLLLMGEADGLAAHDLNGDSSKKESHHPW